MTTHFTSGVTNVVTGGTGEHLKQPDPIKYHVYHEDFDKYTASDWVITTTEGGSGNASEALGDGDGGLLVVTNDDADDDSDEFQWAGGSGAATEALGDGDGGLLVVTNDDADDDSDEFQWAGGSGGVIESFKYEAAKGLYFKTRFKVSDATQSDFAVGLVITDTTIIDGVTDGIFFRKADGSTSMELVIEKDSTETTVSCGTAADDTFMTLAFYYDPKDRKFHAYKDNVEVGTGVNTNAPDDEELAVSFALQNGEAVAKVMTLDYISAGKERTANTEL